MKLKSLSLKWRPKKLLQNHRAYIIPCAPANLHKYQVYRMCTVS